MTSRRWSPTVRVAVGLATLSIALTASATTASATDAAVDANGGLVVEVRAQDALHPVVALTNRGRSACTVSTTPYGTISLTRIEQRGAAPEPILFDPVFPDGVDAVIRSHLRTLNPGDGIDIPIPVVRVGPTGQALEVITGSADVGPLGTFYPISAGDPIDMEAVYAVPVVLTGEQSVCAAATSAAGGASRSPGWLRWALLGGTVLVLALVVLAPLRPGRRRRARSVAAVAVLLIALGAAITLDQRPAAATITFDDPDLQKRFDSCVSTFSMEGGDPANIFPTLDNPDHTVQVTRADPNANHTDPAGKGHAIVFWDPDSSAPYNGEPNNFPDPCSSLYHEFFHAFDILNNQLDRSICVTAEEGDTGIRVSEVRATRAQNLLRKKLQLPQREHWGGMPLPKGECLPKDKQKPPKTCGGAGCGDSNGDTHLATFDGARYDFQAVGEFVLARDPGAGFEVQVRQEPLLNTRIASVNTAVAMDVAGTTLELRRGGKALEMLVNHSPVQLAKTNLPTGGSVEPDFGGTGATVSWPDGSTLTATSYGRWMIHLQVEPAAARAGRLDGLLGDFNRDPANDIRPRGGQPIATPPTFAALYPSFADSWRIDQASSLFTYLAGTGTLTYTDRTFPDRPGTVDQLPNRAWAQAVCERFGITDPVTLAGCVLDVALSGQPDFAVAAAASQGYVGGLVVDGPPLLVRLSAATPSARLGFEGSAGQRVFVQVMSTTLPSECGVLRLNDPTGAQLASGCLISGTGNINSTTLPVTGRYTVEIKPATPTAADVVLRVVTVTDQQQTLAANGPPLLATIGQPGAVARLTFSGTAGEKVFINATAATLPDECGVLVLRAPGGQSLASGCLITGAGYIDRTILPAAGVYTVEVDPRDDTTGQVRLGLAVAADQESAVTLNTSTLTATISQPGAISRFTFTAAAGTRIFVDVLSSTVPNSCGVVQLLNAAGEHLVAGCIINGTGELLRDGAVLPAAGSYAVVIDPNGADVGLASLRIHT